MDTEIPGLIPFLCPISSMYPVLAHRVCHSPVHSLTVLINTRHTILPIHIQLPNHRNGSLLPRTIHPKGIKLNVCEKLLYERRVGNEKSGDSIFRTLICWIENVIFDFQKSFFSVNFALIPGT